MRRILLRRPVMAGAAGAALIALAAGISLAAIPDSSGIYTGCYSTKSSPVGRLRVINPRAGQRCKAGEVQITWNQRGITWKGVWSASRAYQRGDAVVRSGTSYIAIAANMNHIPPNTTYWNQLAQRGSPGARGPRGLRGTTGLQGVTGPTGPTGPTGVAYFAKQEANGPLPQTLTFTSVPAGTAIIQVEGTAYASATGRYWVTVNPSDIGFCGASSRYPTLFFNQTGVHAVLIPMTWQVCLAAGGDHTVQLTPSSNSLVTDVNDFFTVSLTVYTGGTTVAAEPVSKPTAPPAPGMSPGS